MEFRSTAEENLPYSIEAAGDFAPGSRPGCSITVAIHSFPPEKPAFQMLDPALVPVAKPSVGLLHHSLDGVDVPAEGVSLPFRCEVSRVLGNLHTCISSGEESNVPFAVGAARRRLSAYAYDPKQLDADNDVPLYVYVDVEINLSRTDRRTAEPPTNPGNSTSQIGWAQTATPADLTRVYPAKALRQGIEGRVVASCRVEVDLSLVCFGLERDPSIAGVFDEAVYKLLLRYRAQAKAKDGTSAVGSWRL